MSLLDGLKDSMKNPLAENNEDMEFVLESDFDLALEKATDVRLSPEDIRAILNGDDDIPDDDDDLDDPDDDIDKDYTSELEACKEALEATMTELGIDTAGDELSEDDTDDLELDPEGDDEIISEEQLIAECESLISDTPSEDFDEDDEPPADDSVMESPDYEAGADKNTQVKGITESDDEDDEDDDDEDEEHEEHESKHHEHEEHETEEEEEEEHRNHEDDDEEEEDKHDHHKKHDDDEDDESESEDDEKESDDEDEDAEEATLESILDNLLGIPM